MLLVILSFLSYTRELIHFANQVSGFQIYCNPQGVGKYYIFTLLSPGCASFCAETGRGSKITL